MKKVKENKWKKQFIEEATTHIKRDGINDLIDYLSKNDFFEAPASTKFHDSCDHGLVMHSLTVFDCAMSLKETFDVSSVIDTSIAICALFHDVCKMNFYEKVIRNRKIDGEWHQIEEWGVKEQLPMGHGEKSVYLINKFMTLTDDEALAIRWHLGGFDTAVHFPYPYGNPSKQAFRENKLVSLIAIADLSAAYLMKD
jgi:hypothetical protein